MATTIKGISITLYKTTENGVDEFNHKNITETAVTVKDVLAAPASDTEITDALNLYGKKAIYTLAIPKGDTNDWENKRVKFFGKEWRVIGKPTEGIDDLIPLRWNKKVKVESYVSES